MTTIVEKAGNLQELIRRLSLPFRGEVLFNPLRLLFDPPYVKTALQSQTKTAFVQARIELDDIEGEGEVILDAAELLEYLGLYAPDETISVSIDDTVIIKGKRKTVTLYPEALTPRIPASVPQLRDGRIEYKRGDDSFLASTIVKLKAEDLGGLIEDARVVEVAEFPLDFRVDEQKLSRVALGSQEPKHNRIDVVVDAEVEGVDAGTLIGEDFAYLFDNLVGEVELQLSDGTPLAAIVDVDEGRFLYVLTPRRT